jgi:hypothetical protein
MEIQRQKTPEEVRIAARDRKRAQRERDALREEESRFSTLDPAERRVQEIMAGIAAEDKTQYKPGIPHPKEDPEAINTRSDKFDGEKAECERKAMEESKRTIFALTHGLPVGWATLYPEQFPKETINAA